MASVLKPRFYTAGYEVIGESAGTLGLGDSLVLCSDGVYTGRLGDTGFTFGIGSEGVAEYLNHCFSQGISLSDVTGKVLEMTERISGGRHEDDTTFAALTCRTAHEITILSGPPSVKSKDSAFVVRFMASPGTHAVCGSTTAEVSRPGA